MQIKSLAEQLFFTTVRIDTVAANGAQGSGTGFLFVHKIGEQAYPFVVTNKHVVIGASEGALTFLQAQENLPSLGNGFRLSIDGWGDAWFGHPSSEVDIAICPLAPLVEEIKEKHGVDLFYRWVDSTTIPTPQQLDELDAIESVTFIG